MMWWRSSALLAAALSVACTPKSSISFELGRTITHAVLLAVNPADGSFVGASGLLSPPFAEIMEDRPSATLIALGFDDQALPGPFSGSLSAPAVLASGCAPRLPDPTRAVRIRGPSTALPALAAPWLEESCPFKPDALLIEDSGALQRCTGTLLPIGDCAFELELVTETCGGRMGLAGRVQPDGQVCAQTHPPIPDCIPATDGTGAILCTNGRRRVELRPRQPSPMRAETIAIGGARPRRVPNRLRPLNVESGIDFSVRLLASLNEGYLSDLAVIGQEILVLEHDGRFMAHGCVSEDGGSVGPSRILTYDANLSALVRTTTVPACAVRLLAGPGAIYTVHGGPAASITKLDRGGRILGTAPICPGEAYALIAGVDVSLEGQIGVLLDSQPYTNSVHFALFGSDLAPIGDCKDILGWWSNDPSDAPAIGTDLRALPCGKWVMADASVAGGWIFDGELTAKEGRRDPTAAVRFSAQRGLEVPTDIGLITPISAKLLAIARPNRAAAIDLQGTDAFAQIVVLPNLNSDARPLRAVPWNETLATPLWQLSGSTLTAALGSIRGTPPRVEPYETQLGPGIVGSTAIDPTGRLLILRPWSSEIVRVSR